MPLLDGPRPYSDRVVRRLWVAVAVPVAVLLCTLWAHLLTREGYRLNLSSPPFVGHADVRTGVGTPLAVLLAALVIWRGPQVAQRSTWNTLLGLTFAGATAWAVSLALVDGPRRGLRYPLTSRDEYLHDVPRVHDVTGFLGEFAQHVVVGPGQWVTQVSGHPPGLLLLLAGLRRIGLRGPWPATVLVVLAGCSAVVAVLVVVRAVAGEAPARLCAPFLVLLPAAIWIAVSGDALFLGVGAWGVACLALGRPMLGGVLLGAGLMLTYGLLTLAPLALGVLVIRRRPRDVLVAAAGVLAVLGVFAALGFWWLDGFHQTLIRYSQGAGGYRPFFYFVVANLVVFAVAVGPAAVAGLLALQRRDQLSWLVGLGVLCVLLADVSGKSKAEAERIWVLFAPWVTIAAARLDRPRVWLAVQAATGLVVESTLLTKW